MQDLYEKVKQWGVDMKITGPEGKGTIEGQFWKFIEEMNELGQAIKANNVKEIRDALGDLQVVAIQANSITDGIDTIPVDHRQGRVTAHKDIESLAAMSVIAILTDPSAAFTGVRQIAIRLNHDPDECLQEAYDVISKRTGRMENGVFVKDSK